MRDLHQYTIVASGKMRQVAYDKLNAAARLIAWQQKGRPPEAEFAGNLAQADALYSTGNIKIDEKLLAQAPRLKVIAQASVGYDNIDIEACARRGIAVGHTPGVLTDAVADLAYGLIIDSARKITRGSEHVRSGRWGERKGLGFGVDLAGKTLGIFGMGDIGAAVAVRALVSKMKIIYHNRRPRRDDAAFKAAYVGFEELLAQSDFLVITATLNQSTRGLFNAGAFAQMKPTASLINVARGAIVETQALYDALKHGAIAYAALDVTDPEPLPGSHELLKLDNVTVTPHIAASTVETRDAMALLTADNILAGLSGEPLPAQVKNTNL